MRRKDEMQKLGDFLLPALAKKGLKKISVSAEVCFLAGNLKRRSFEPISFDKGILKVSVSSSSAAQEVQMDSEKIIEYLNRKIGYKAIRSIRTINGVTDK